MNLATARVGFPVSPHPPEDTPLAQDPQELLAQLCSPGELAGPLWLLWCSHCCHMGYAPLSSPGGHTLLPLPTGLCVRVRHLSTHTGLHVPQCVVCVCVHLIWCSVLERTIPPLSGYTEVGSPKTPVCVQETRNTDTRSCNPCQPCQATPRGRWSCAKQASGKRCGANCFVTCFYDIIILI